MTAPQQAAPGAPADQGTSNGQAPQGNPPAPQQQPAQPQQPETQQPPTGQAPAPRLEDLLAGLDEDARKIVLDELGRARSDAARYRNERQTAMQQAQAAQQQREAVLKAFGLKADGTDDVDPAKAAEEAAERAWLADVKLAIYRSADRLGADPGRLLRGDAQLPDPLFAEILDQNVTVEPGDPQFVSQVDAAIQAAIERDASFRRAAARFQGGAEGGPQGPGGGGPNRPPQVTEEQLKTMTPDEIVKAQKEGRLADLLGG